jgi:hypothetical protein
MDVVFGWLIGHSGNISLGSITILFVYGLLTGRIVPRSVLDDVRTDRDSRLEAKEKVSQEWRQAYLNEHERGLVQDKQVVELLEHSRTTVRLLQAFPLPKEDR